MTQPFRKLSKPFLLSPGVPIGLTITEDSPSALSYVQKLLLEGMLKGERPKSQGHLVKPLQLLEKKGLVRKDFGPRGSASKRKRRGITWDGGYVLVNPDEARAVLAVEALEQASQGDVAQGFEPNRPIFKGGTFKVTTQIKGFEVDPTSFVKLQNNTPVLKEIGKAVGLHYDEKNAKWIVKP